MIFSDVGGVVNKYGRSTSAAVADLEAKLMARYPGAGGCSAMTCGMNAISTLVRTLVIHKDVQHILHSDELYSDTPMNLEAMKHLRKGSSIPLKVEQFELAKQDELLEKVGAVPTVLFVESSSNPNSIPFDFGKPSA